MLGHRIGRAKFSPQRDYRQVISELDVAQETERICGSPPPSHKKRKKPFPLPSFHGVGYKVPVGFAYSTSTTPSSLPPSLSSSFPPPWSGHRRNLPSPTTNMSAPCMQKRKLSRNMSAFHTRFFWHVWCRFVCSVGAC